VAAERTGKPLAGATLNRYIGQLASVYGYARRLRLLPRTHVPPTKGVEKAPETTRHDRCFTADEVERLIKVARVVDQRWRRLPAFIAVGYCTGLRKTNLLNLRWRDVDTAARTVQVAMTKNGTPHVAALSASAIDELKKLSRRHADELVFEGRDGRPFNPRRLWLKVTAEAGLTGRTIHALRHSCGHALATAGIGQAGIMQVMGHRTLTASARYVHANASDKRRIITEVFG
jgi:integrase